jgi:hypothetical protein
MIHNKKEFSLGAALFVGFWAVFAVLMSPVFAGQNILNYMDNLYNTISKHSAYYIPAAKEKTTMLIGKDISFAVLAKNEAQAARTARNFETSGSRVSVDGHTVRVTGDMGWILNNILDDADAMYANNGEAVAAKYGMPERLVMYDWWNALKSGQDDLNHQQQFADAKVFYDVMTRGVEPSYNYYEIEAVQIREKAGTVILSLAGYVFYTLWFGFAILFMFEGWGVKLEH